MENINFTSYLNEVNYHKVMQALRGDVPHIESLAIVTANNPMGQELPARENNKRNEQLFSYLSGGNFRFVSVAKPVRGMYDNMEDSFLVTNISREQTIEIGKTFAHKAVIWGAKKTDEGEPYIEFEYIGRNDENEPFQTLSLRRVALSGSDVQNRKNYFSAFKLPRNPKTAEAKAKKRGAVPSSRKFVIPFFEPEYERARWAKGKRTIAGLEMPTTLPLAQAEQFYIPFFDDETPVVRTYSRELSFVASELPDTPEVKMLVEKIQERHAALKRAGMTGRYYWENRGVLLTLMNEVRALIRQE